jgi:hypothetical protein
MRRISVTAAAFAALSTFCGPASAATIISDNGNLDEVIHGASKGTTTGTSLTLDSKSSGFLIQYLSSDVLSVTGKGVAKVTGDGGGFSDLTITPLSNITFTAFKFNLNIPKGPAMGYSTDFTFDTQVFFSGGASQTFADVDLGDGKGANRFLITSDVGQYINKIVISDLEGVSTKSGNPTIDAAYNFDAIKQASFNFAPGVPEPATWAEFILGFGLAGVMLRRRRGQAPVPA